VESTNVSKRFFPLRMVFVLLWALDCTL